MPIAILDGFEDYPGRADAGIGLISEWWGSNATGNSQLSLVAGRVGGQAVRFRGSVFLAKPIPASTEVAGFFAIRRITNAGSNVLVLANGATYVQHIRFAYDADGVLTVYGPTDVVLGFIDFALPFNTWASIAYAAKIDDTLGSVTIWINGEKKLEVTNVDTKANAVANVDRIRFTSNAGLATDGFDLDDVRVDNATLVQIPEGRFAVVAAIADVTSDFTPLSGADNFAMVDDTTCDADVSYNVSNTVGHKDKFSVAELPFNPDVIYAVQLSMASRKEDVATRRMQMFLESGAATTTGPDKFETTDYTFQRLIMTDNPDTATPFTKATLASVMIGYELIE